MPCHQITNLSQREKQVTHNVIVLALSVEQRTCLLIQTVEVALWTVCVWFANILLAYCHFHIMHLHLGLINFTKRQ